MRHYEIFLVLLALVGRCLAQDATTPGSAWNGDPNICIPDNSPPNPNDPPIPNFPIKAEFTLEQVIQRNDSDGERRSVLSLHHYLYDYTANSLILIQNTFGLVDVEYYYYKILKRSIYLRGEFCFVTDITKNDDDDGRSAIDLPGEGPHIRPLNDFLLFSRNDPRYPQIRPKFINQTIIRGIPANLWQTCLVNPVTLRTERRIWALAASNAILPTGAVGNNAVPIAAWISISLSYPNGTINQTIAETFHVHSFRDGIMATTTQLAPPKGVYCNSSNDQNLGSLEEIGIEWPERFSVRVEASSSRSAEWQRFHLRYDRGRQRGGRRIRYDYLPPGSQDYRSVIHDYAENLTYIIDLQTGGCRILHLVDRPDVSPIRDPIEFFIKYESKFLLSRREKIWEFNGYRPCRGEGVTCTIVTTAFPNFPPMVDPDTGRPNGDNWAGTSVEYAWSMRSPSARPPTSDSRKEFDYPAHIFMRLYSFRDPVNPSPFEIRTEDVEYEFYEMSQESKPYDFDTSTCYRANQLQYLHLGFIMTTDRGSVIDGNQLNRRVLEREIHALLADRMQIKYSRISGLEFEHEQVNNELIIFFTLLGQTPNPGSDTGVISTEPTTQQASDRLRTAIDGNNFRFPVRLNDNSSTEVQFSAKANSLNSSKLFMSTHAGGAKTIENYYTSSSQAIAVIFGILIGLLVGVLLAAVIRVIRKEPMPDLPGIRGSVTNPLPKISFHNKPAAEASKPTTDA